MRSRAPTIERIFGILKWCMGLSRFKLRTTAGAHLEFGLTALAYNIRRLLRALLYLFRLLFGLFGRNLSLKSAEPDEGVLGDIVLCPAFLGPQMEQSGRTLDQELAFLVVHGTLHLIGYDHMEVPNGCKHIPKKDIYRSSDADSPSN